MALSTSRLFALLAKHGEDCTSLLLVGEFAETAPSADVLSFAEVLSETPDERRYTVGVCVNPCGDDVHTLARLRDVLCERVLITQESSAMSASELLSLGFQKFATEDDCTLFLHSAEVTDRPRDWNNSKHWAHPENFDKHRA